MNRNISLLLLITFYRKGMYGIHGITSFFFLFSPVYNRNELYVNKCSISHTFLKNLPVNTKITTRNFLKILSAYNNHTCKQKITEICQHEKLKLKDGYECGGILCVYDSLIFVGYKSTVLPPCILFCLERHAFIICVF